MNFTQMYESFQALENPSFWQDIYMRFYRAWFEGDRWMQYFEGLGTTILVTILALLIGVILGVVVAVIRTGHDQQRKGKHNPVLAVLNLICKIYVTVIRGTPMLVQLMIMGFVVFQNSRNFTMVGALALGINSGAYVAETIRGGIMSIDRGQMEAGLSLGLSRTQTMRSVILPQAIKNILPALGNEFIMLLKETSIAGYVAIQDLTFAGDRIRSSTFVMFLPLLAVALIYLVIVLGLSQLLKVFERRLARSDSR